MYPDSATGSALTDSGTRFQKHGSDYRSRTGVEKSRLQVQTHGSHLHQLELHSSVGVLGRKCATFYSCKIFSFVQAPSIVTLKYRCNNK